MRLVTIVVICYLLYHSCLHFDIIIKPSSLCVHNVINIYLSRHQYHILYQYYIHIYPELVLVTLISGSKQDIVYNIQELNIYIHTYIYWCPWSTIININITEFIYSYILMIKDNIGIMNIYLSIFLFQLNAAIV